MKILIAFIILGLLFGMVLLTLIGMLTPPAPPSESELFPDDHTEDHD